MPLVASIIHLATSAINGLMSSTDKAKLDAIKTLHVFSATDNHPPASSYATLDTRNSHPVLDFDAAADESAIFAAVLSRTYTGLGLTVILHWTATSATSGTCRWAVSFERCNTDIDADSFATANTAGTTTNGTSGIINTTSINFANGAEMDSLAVGERFRLKVMRDADGTSGTDDMAGDAELLAVEIREQ